MVTKISPQWNLPLSGSLKGDHLYKWTYLYLVGKLRKVVQKGKKLKY